MADILEQFSIDWLVGSNAKKAQQQDIGSSSLNEAFFLYSQPIINKLRNSENQQMHLHDLVKAVNEEISVSSFDEFRTVINRLVDRGVIDIVEQDSLTGNNLLRLHKE